MLGGPILAIGILWLGRSGHYESVPWWVPALSTIFIGLAITLIFISFIVGIISRPVYIFICGLMMVAQSYLIDTYHVCSVGTRRPHDHAFGDGRSVPTYHDADAPQLGKTGRWHRASPRTDAIPVP
jgi:hypothetical protein